MNRLMTRAPVLIAVLALTAAPAAAQQRSVEYEIAFPNAVHHEAQVTATFRGVPQGRPLQLRMSRSSPGRYALHEFAKNVYDVRVTDASGRALDVTRPNPHQWDVTPRGSTVLTDAEQKKLEDDLIAARTRTGEAAKPGGRPD